MKLRTKRIISWLMVLLMLASTVISPYFASAFYTNTTYENALAKNDFKSLNNLVMKLKAVRDCTGSIAKITMDLDSVDKDERKNVDMWANGSFEFDGGFNYLRGSVVNELTGMNENAFCYDLPKNTLTQILIQYFSDFGVPDLVDLYCGKNNEGGLFKIGANRDINGWPSLNGEAYFTDCKAAFWKVREYASSDAITDSKITIVPNGTFDVYGYFEDAIVNGYGGNKTTVEKAIKLENLWQNFQQQCPSNEISADDFRNRPSGAANYFASYHNGNLRYYTLSDPSALMYTNFSSDTFTRVNLDEAVNPEYDGTNRCDIVALTFWPSNDILGEIANDVAGVQNQDKEVAVADCKNTTVSNEEKILEQYNAVYMMSTGASDMYDTAKQFADNPSKDNYEGVRDTIHRLRDEIIEISNGLNATAVGGFKEKVEEFSREYLGHLSHGGINNDTFYGWSPSVQNELDSVLAAFNSNINRFDDQVLVPAGERLGMLSDVEMKSDSDYIHNSDGTVKDSVDGFYHFDDKNVLVCDANDNDTQIGQDIINNIFGGSIEFVDYVPFERETDDDGSDQIQPGNATSSCQGAGGAGALGWIVCPIMEWMGGVATDAYNDFLKPQLQVAPELFANGQSGASYNAWSIFQGIANTIFSIILLIVIFSQLTGVGIDNYGIKRILPKLIIAAVATNLSYVICQLAVDLSNILGNSLQALFDGLAYGGSAMSFTVEGISQGSSIGPTILTGAVIAGVLVIGGVAIWSNPAILLTLLVGLIGVVVAILFIFILLAARQAAVLILVVISPLAFVCYALPNTKKLFDKWLKMMQGLLIVYPICGLLIGGGNFASKLLLASGQNVSFISAFVAMLVSIVPLFFVPTVLKNSMNALGGLGGKISGIGKGLGGRAQGTVRNSRGFKDAQKRSNARGDRLFDRRRAGIHIDRDGNVRNNRLSVRRRVAGTRIGRMMGWDAATGAAQAQYVKEQMDRRANINTFNERGIIDSQVTKAQNAEEERIIAGQVGVARNTDMARAGIRQKAENEKMESEIKMDINVAPINPTNVQQRLRNQLHEALADNQVPVVPVQFDLALQRRRAAADSQELKNYTDQFANYTKDQLSAEANSASSWIGSTGGTQRMQALLSTMESRGMENNIAEMLENGGDAIGKNAAVMQTLAGSKNRVFKAYGKAGAGMSYHNFMSGGKEQYLDANGNVTTEATDASGNANRRAYVDVDTGKITDSAMSASGKQNSTARTRSIVDYARDKGTDFIEGLDDKALNQIMKYQTGQAGAPMVQIMDGDMVAAAQSRINAQDAVNILDGLATHIIEHGGKVNYSSSQYANLNQSSMNTLDRLASQYDSVHDNLVNISDEAVRSPELRAKLNDAGTNVLNNSRNTRTDGGDSRNIQDAI